MMLLGCYSERKASKQLFKVQAHYPYNIAKLCSSIYPPISLIKDSVVHLRGTPNEELVFVEVDCDSVVKSLSLQQRKVVKAPCPTSIYQIDTLLIYKERQVIDRAEVKLLTGDLSVLNDKYIKTKHENYILLRIAIVLGVYTLLRWVLRIWHIKLP